MAVWDGLQVVYSESPRENWAHSWRLARSGEELAARMKAGVASTDCDLQQLGHVAALAGDMFMERHERFECEEDLAMCERGQWDVEDCCDYQETSRVQAAIDAVYDCAEACR